MASLRLFMLVLIFCLCSSSFLLVSARPKPSRTQSYIESSCKKTRFRSLCIHCLSSYAKSKANLTIESPQQLAKIALSVSLYRATQTKIYMRKVARELRRIKAKEYRVVQDCLDEINDSVTQLSESTRELQSMEHQTVTDDFLWHVSNVETWVSAALTDATTCADQFPGRRMSKLRATIKGKVLNVAQVTSNALALFHHYAARYRARDTPKP